MKVIITFYYFKTHFCGLNMIQNPQIFLQLMMRNLAILLRPTHMLGKDYRLLADKMGYKYEYIKYLESLPQPVKELFIKFAREERRTIKELLSLLKQIDRPDVVEDLQPYIGRINFFLLVVGGYKIFLVDIDQLILNA